mgnify:FL=1
MSKLKDTDLSLELSRVTRAIGDMDRQGVETPEDLEALEALKTARQNIAAELNRRKAGGQAPAPRQPRASLPPKKQTEAAAVTEAQRLMKQGLSKADAIAAMQAEGWTVKCPRSP